MPIICTHITYCTLTHIFSVFKNELRQLIPDIPRFDIPPSKFKIHDFRENWENFRRFWMIIWLNFLTMFIQEHFSVLRRLTYPDADVFIICFSIIDPYSFKRVQTKWVKELSEYCPNTPVVLVGTKYDQRNNINTKILLNKHGLQPVSSEQGEQVARKIGAKQVRNKNYPPHSPWFHPNFILTRYQCHK